MPTIHIHADESGDLRFDNHGSRYFTFTVTWTYDPAAMANSLQHLRFALLRDGHGLERFHAKNDRRWMRERVFGEMMRHNTWDFAAIVVDKRKLYPALREPLRFYPKFLSMALRFVLNGRIQLGTDRVLIYTDPFPISRKRKAIAKAIHQSCAACLGGHPPFHIYHHSATSNAWLQVTDYCCWAVHRRYEHGDRTYYDIVRPRLARPELLLWR